MSSEIPESLRKTVWRDGAALCFWTPGESWRLMFAHQVTMWLLAVGALTTILTLGIGVLFWVGWIPMLVALWVWVFRQSTEYRIARADAEGFQLSGPFRVRDPVPEHVVVTGPLGRECAVFVGKRRVLQAKMEVGGPWTPTSLNWFVTELGRTMGAPVHDHRPRDAWRRWEKDPAFRASAMFDVAQATDRERHPHLRAGVPEPLPLTMDHHGMTVFVAAGLPPFVPATTVSMTLDTLRCGEMVLPLAEVLRAGWLCTGTGEGLALEFQVLTRNRWVRLFSVHGPSTVARLAPGLSWLETEILERAEDARRRNPTDRGAASEVPDALREMTKRTLRAE